MNKDNFFVITPAISEEIGKMVGKFLEENAPFEFLEDLKEKPVMGTKPGYLSYVEATDSFVLNENPPQQVISTKVYVESIIELDNRLHHSCWAVIDKDDWQKKNYGIFADEKVARNQMKEAGVPNLKVVLVTKY